MSVDATRDGVQLITYADRFGGTLRGLKDLLDGPLSGVFEGVHILPFFTPFDGADAGFDPVDHTEVDPRLGSWDDVRAIGADHTLMVDMIVNHVSADSPEFRDVVARGTGSPHMGLFLTMSDVYPSGADEQELVGIYRPRTAREQSRSAPVATGTTPSSRSRTTAQASPRRIFTGSSNPSSRPSRRGSAPASASTPRGAL